MLQISDQIPTNNNKILTKVIEILSAQKFGISILQVNFAKMFFLNFRPKFCIFGHTFSDKKDLTTIFRQLKI